MDEEEARAREARTCAEIEAAFENDPHGIAAILIEPIQCEGGDHHFRPEFFRRLREYADRYEALLVFDEVQTGMGATGAMWGFEHTGITPDLIAFGKKTQVCGVMSTRRIDEVERKSWRAVKPRRRISRGEGAGRRPIIPTGSKAYMPGWAAMVRSWSTPSRIREAGGLRPCSFSNSWIHRVAWGNLLGSMEFR